MDREAVRRECLLYHDTVGFFSVFGEELASQKIQIEIERDFVSPQGGSRTPDFAVFDGKKMTDVLDHKASLPNPDQALKDLKYLAEKYKTLEHEGKVFDPAITVLYPVSKQGIVDAIKPDLPKALGLCAFDQSSSHTEISFSLDGHVRDKELRGILTGEPISYNPAVTFSRYKFIRAGPHVVYSAFEIWRLLPGFQNIRNANEESYSVPRTELLKRAQVFYPPWIRNNVQLNSGRVDAALKFLDQIGFVEWEDGGSEIAVLTGKGTRSGDLVEHFSDRFSKLISRREAKTLAKMPKSQTTLESFKSRKRERDLA